VLVPESGDGVQAMKAGLMEIGDLFAINKADREGAERAAFAVRSALELKTGSSGWQPPVLLTVASQGTGVAELLEQIEAHLEFLEAHGGLESRRRRRYEERVSELLRQQLWRTFRGAVSQGWAAMMNDYFERRLSPHEVSERLLGPTPQSLNRRVDRRRAELSHRLGREPGTHHHSSPGRKRERGRRRAPGIAAEPKP
jgi:LAO/AO transport system kinase